MKWHATILHLFTALARAVVVVVVDDHVDCRQTLHMQTSKKIISSERKIDYNHSVDKRII